MNFLIDPYFIKSVKSIPSIHLVLWNILIIMLNNKRVAYRNEESKLMFIKLASRSTVGDIT